MNIILEPSAYTKYFYDPLISHDRYLILFGGRGSGKTDTLFLKYLLELFQPYPFRLAYVNKEKSSIRDQQYAGFKRVAKRTGLFNRLKFYDGDYRIVNEKNGNALIPKGMDDPEKTKGLDEITAIWWDEINKGTLDDFLTLNALLRSPEAKYLQFAMSFNPVSESHWLRHQFFDKNDAYKINPMYQDSTLLHHSTYLDNDFIDKDAYLKTLEQNAQGNVNRMLVDIKGLWGVAMLDNPFFYAYNKDIHYVDERFRMPEEISQIYLSFDFNNDPCTLLIGLIDGKDINIIDLIDCDEHTYPPSSTLDGKGLSPLEACCEKFNEKYVRSGILTPNRIIVTGDASGTSKSADNKANSDFYTKIQDRLRISESQVRKRKANILHSMSKEMCNALFYNANVKIYKSAYLLTEDFGLAYTDDNGTLNKAKKEHGLHFTDAFRYMADCMLGFDEWQSYIKYYAKAA